jgi:hypothetical protein
MTRYLISFDDGAMQISEEELPAVDDAAHAVVDEAKAAGAWITGGGVLGHEARIVAVDGSVTDAAYPDTRRHIGGFSIVEASSHEEALTWAAKFAAACRCAQEVRELMPDAKV